MTRIFGGLCHRPQDRAGRLDAVQQRHPHIHRNHIGPQLADQRDDRGPVGGLTDHLDIRL